MSANSEQHAEDVRASAMSMQPMVDPYKEAARLKAERAQRAESVAPEINVTGIINYRAWCSACPWRSLEYGRFEEARRQGGHHLREKHADAALSAEDQLWAVADRKHRRIVALETTLREVERLVKDNGFSEGYLTEQERALSLIEAALIDGRVSPDSNQTSAPTDGSDRE